MKPSKKQKKMVTPKVTLRFGKTALQDFADWLAISVEERHEKFSVMKTRDIFVIKRIGVLPKSKQ